MLKASRSWSSKRRAARRAAAAGSGRAPRGRPARGLRRLRWPSRSWHNRRQASHRSAAARGFSPREVVMHTLSAGRRAVPLVVAAVRCRRRKDDTADKIRVILIDGQNNHDWRSTTPLLKKHPGGDRQRSPSMSPATSSRATSRATVERPCRSRRTWQVRRGLSNYNGAPWPEEFNEGAREARSRTARSAWSSSTRPTTPSAAGRNTTR